MTLAQLAAHFGGGIEPGINLKPQGDARIRKRAGSSRAIGAAARWDANWSDRSDLLWLCLPLQRQMALAWVRERLIAWNKTRQ